MSLDAGGGRSGSGNIPGGAETRQHAPTAGTRIDLPAAPPARRAGRRLSTGGALLDDDALRRDRTCHPEHWRLRADREDAVEEVPGDEPVVALRLEQIDRQHAARLG